MLWFVPLAFTGWALFVHLYCRSIRRRGGPWIMDIERWAWHLI